MAWADDRPVAMTSASGVISLVTVAIRHVGGQACVRSTFDLWHQQSFGSTRFTAMQRGFIPSYSTTIADADSKKRYADKLDLVNGIDPYEIPRNEWQDNIDMWPAITHVHVCMYLLQAPTLRKTYSTTRVWTATRTLCEDG